MNSSTCHRHLASRSRAPDGRRANKYLTQSPTYLLTPSKTMCAKLAGGSRGPKLWHTFDVLGAETATWLQALRYDYQASLRSAITKSLINTDCPVLVFALSTTQSTRNRYYMLVWNHMRCFQSRSEGIHYLQCMCKNTLILSLPPSLAGSFSLHEPFSLHDIAPGSPPTSVQPLPHYGAETPPRHERFRNCEL